MLLFHLQQGLYVLRRVFHQNEHFPVLTVILGHEIVQRLLQRLHGGRLRQQCLGLGLLRIDEAAAELVRQLVQGVNDPRRNHCGSAEIYQQPDHFGTVHAALLASIG
jgi:hypothetical protein